MGLTSLRRYHAEDEVPEVEPVVALADALSKAEAAAAEASEAAELAVVKVEQLTAELAEAEEAKANEPEAEPGDISPELAQLIGEDDSEPEEEATPEVVEPEAVELAEGERIMAPAPAKARTRK